jgi:hypothetical protein
LSRSKSSPLASASWRAFSSSSSHSTRRFLFSQFAGSCARLSSSTTSRLFRLMASFCSGIV